MAWDLTGRSEVKCVLAAISEVFVSLPPCLGDGGRAQAAEAVDVFEGGQLACKEEKRRGTAAGWSWESVGEPLRHLKCERVE